MPGGKIKQKPGAADAGLSPGEILLMLYAATDYDQVFTRTGKTYGELELSGGGFVAHLELILDATGAPEFVAALDLDLDDGTHLASGLAEEMRFDDFFDALQKGLDHHRAGDLDGALHHLASVFGREAIRIIGTGLADRILGTVGDNVIKARGGDDTVLGSEGADKINGGAGDNGIFYGSVEVGTKKLGVFGDLLDNVARIKGEDQVIKKFVDLGGTDGRDTLLGDDRGNFISGRGGDDSINGRGGDDFIFGEAGDDDLKGSGGDDYVDGGEGNDSVEGGTGGDFLSGGGGDDAIAGQSGDDKLFGGLGDDTIFGGSGDDALFGGADADDLRGGSGKDTLDGGDGDDLLTGGGGADEFVLVTGGGADIIADFEAGTDRIRVDLPFGDLTFADVPGGAEIRTAGGELIGTVKGVDAATLNDADNFF